MSVLGIFVQIARLGLWLERVWVVFIWPLMVLALFLCSAMLGLWHSLPFYPHLALLVIFGLSFVVTFIAAWPARPKFPSSYDGRSLLEKRQKLPHRPLTHMADKPAIFLDDEHLTLWQRSLQIAKRRAHRAGIYKPQTQVIASDKYGLRYAVLGIVLLTFFASSANTNLQQTLWPENKRPIYQIVQGVDVWVKPPAYTQKSQIKYQAGEDYVFPAGSTFDVRVHVREALRQTPHLRVNHEDVMALEQNNQLYQGTYTLAEQANQATYSKHTFAVKSGGTTLFAGDFYLQPDMAPTINFAGDITRTSQGYMNVKYKAYDDYGIAKIEAVITRRDGTVLDKENIPISKKFAAKLAATTQVNFSDHPLAGTPVMFYVQATDEAEQLGKSAKLDVVLPEREFSHPVAQRLIKLRRGLYLNPKENISAVLLGLSDILGNPTSFDEQILPYMALTVAQQGLVIAGTESVERAVELMWQAALTIESGPLALQLERIMDAQRALQEALSRGASGAELDALYAKLAEAMSQLLNMASLGNKSLEEMTGVPNIQNKDLAALAQRIQELLEAGAHEQAQKALAELGTLLSNMQIGQASSDMAKLQKIFENIEAITREQAELHKNMPTGDKDTQNNPWRKKQQQLLDDLKKVKGECQGLGLPTQELNEAMEAMEEALQTDNTPQGRMQAKQAQTKAIEALSKSQDALIQQLVKQMGQGMQGMRRDPSGRLQPIEGEDVDVPDRAPASLSRQIRDELFKRIDGLMNNPTERNYLERLIDGF